MASVNLPEKIFGVETSLMVVCLPLVGIGLLFLVSLGQVVLPKIEEINAINANIANVEKSTKDIVTKQNYINSVDQEALKKDAEFLANSLIKEKDAYILVKIVRRIADKYGYYVDSFVINPGVIEAETEAAEAPVKKTSSKGEIIEKVPVKMTITGPQDKYLDFIIGIEKSLPLLSIEKLTMKDEEGLTSMDISILSYYIGSKLEFNINNLTLADLTLNKEESELVKKLNQFDYDKAMVLLEDNGSKDKKFVKYELKDPFNN